MYHSEPFFIEFNGTQDDSQLYGVFVDNPGQVFLDVGYQQVHHLLMGSRFGGLDFYISAMLLKIVKQMTAIQIIAAQHARHVTGQYAQLIGTARLKPRYCLVYHQGCYGYDTRDKA